MSVAEDVHPFSIFFAPEIGPNDYALLGFPIFELAIVGHLADGEHPFALAPVRNVVDLSVDGLQARKKPHPSLADLVGAFVEFAIRSNEKDVGAAGKQAQRFFRVEQSVSFEELVVELPVRSNNVARQGSGVLAVRSNADIATERNIDKGIRVVCSERLRMWLPFLE